MIESRPERDVVEERKPQISVVVPAFQAAEVLPRALGSILAQSFTRLELIVVDDGSTDGTTEAVERHRDPRLRFVRQVHGGRSVARNLGASLATGCYLTFLDADDEASPRWLESLVGGFESPDVAVVCCGATIAYNRPHLRRRNVVRLPRDLGPVYNHERGLFLSGTFALRRRVFDDLGGYEKELSFSENTDLAIRLVDYCRARGSKIVALDVPLMVFYNSRPAQGPATSRVRLDAARFMLERHGARYRRYSARGYTNYLAIAAVNAGRLGELPQARRYLAAAVVACPWRLKHYVRLAISLVPPLARRLWGRYATTN